MLESLKIIVLCIAAAILYGVCHDLITTRICVEYFTVFHPPVWGGTTAPTILALTWGVMATWWVGFILSIPALMLARGGSAGPKLAARDLIRPLGYLLLTMAIGSLIAGLTAWFLGSTGVIHAHPDFARLMRREAELGFLIDAWAHRAAYAVGFFGGISVCIWIWWRRRFLQGRERIAARELAAAPT